MSVINYQRITGADNGIWQPVQEISLSEDTASFIVNIPADAKAARITGILAGHSSLSTRQIVQFNGDTGANYDYLEAIFASAGASTAQTNAATSIPVSSLWADGEYGTLDMIIKASPADIVGKGHVIQIQTYTSGLDSHHHSCQWDDDSQITSILFTSLAPFANGYGAGTRLTASVMR